MSSSAYRLVADKKIVVVCGSGGVGKTTISAAIALQAASAGRDTLALTIDPARRLADALGLEEIGNVPAPIDRRLLKEAGIEAAGELSAMMLDAKTAFDSMISRFAPTPAIREAIYDNRLYRNLTGAFSGAQDYAAAETLYELAHRGNYGLIVLDTPPTAHALDFLDAPNRLIELFNDNLVALFLKPTTFGLSLFSRGGGALLAIIEKFTGLELIKEISDFFISVADLIGAFRKRAEAMATMLKEDQSLFVIVTSPDRLAIEEAIHFKKRLEELGMPFGAFVVNRAAPGCLMAEEVRRQFGEYAARLFSGGPDGRGDAGKKTLDGLFANFNNWMSLARAHEKSISVLEEAAGGAPIFLVPQFTEEVADLAGVAALSRALFADDE